MGMTVLADLPDDSSPPAEESVIEEMPGEGDDMTGEEVPSEEDQGSESVNAAVGTFYIPEESSAAYDEIFKIGSDHFVKTENNGGKYGGSALQYLFDGNLNTHWETGRRNTDTFKNSVTITLDEVTELGSVVYYPRVRGSANKGFPTAFSIYSSQTAQGEDFTLVTSGNAAIAAGGTQIRFQPHSFKKLRFVFEKANQDWAAGGELVLYRPDPLVDEVNDLFADGTMSSLKPKYQNLTVLNEMMRRAEENPNKTLEEKVRMALDIQTGAVDYAGQVVALEQRGDGEDHARRELLTSSYASNLLPTGYAARPGDTIKIYVQATDTSKMPKVVFTQQIGRFGNWKNTYSLHNGENIIVAPRIFSDSWKTKTNPGGAIYFLNPYTVEEQGNAPRIRIQGAIDYPLFKDGDNEQEFLNELRAYKNEYDANPDTTIDIVEIYSDLFILNGNLKAAAPFLNGSGNPQKTVDLHNSRVSELLAFAGLDESSPINSRGTSRVNIRLMQPFGAGYAATDHVGIQQSSAEVFFRGELVGWLYSHEIGHQLDMRNGKVPEVTNNMWANHFAVDIQNEYDRVKYNNTFLYLSADNYKELDAVGHNLGLWWQFHLLDKDYWPNYQKAYRAGVAADMGLTNHERMAVVSSYVLGMDVIEHFERNEAISQALTALEVPEAPENIKPWYLWTKATKDRESAFEEDYTPQVVSVRRDADKLDIMLSMDPSADTALLGYEVMQDGKVLGFTKSNNLKTTNFVNDGQEHVYTVRAYDLRLNRTETSEPFTINLDAPQITVTGNTMIALHEEFDPLTVITAVDQDGTSLEEDVQVISNDVDTSARGAYHVTYPVGNDAGVTELTVPVTVVSSFEYLSDIKEESAKVGWGSFQKDKSINGSKITLLRNQKPVKFEKGLGAHASSRIVYDLSDKEYGYFEALAGIDQSMKNANPSAIFRVFVDGEKRYDSGAVSVKDDMLHVLVDVSGAKQLELVTDSNGANSSDHTVWADARLTLNSSDPEIIADDVAFMDPADVDFDEILANVKAVDVEDGDISDAVAYTTDYRDGKTGAFTITYSVTDSDGNEAEITRNLAVVNDFIYASDVNWESAKVGWGSIKKDLSLNGNPVKLHGNDGVIAYEKGIGVHAYSEVVYDLTGQNYYFFESNVGVDATAGNGNSSVQFQVYVDGELKAETGVMRNSDAFEHFSVSLAGAKTLKLVVNNGGDGKSNDHANWADAKFLIAVKEADKDALSAAVEKANELDESLYTAQTWSELTEALEAANEIMERVKATQKETDDALSRLNAALKALVDISKLQDILEFAQGMADLDYVNPEWKHAEERLANLLHFIEKAEKVLEDPEASQKDVDNSVTMLRYCIEEMGQTYKAGGQPVNFAERSDKKIPEGEEPDEKDQQAAEEVLQPDPSKEEQGEGGETANELDASANQEGQNNESVEDRASTEDTGI